MLPHGTDDWHNVEEPEPYKKKRAITTYYTDVRRVTDLAAHAVSRSTIRLRFSGIDFNFGMITLDASK
jgi:hypothetical protein